MTFPYGLSTPHLYPSLEMEPQDEEMRTVLALSIITAKEDELKRNQRVQGLPWDGSTLHKSESLPKLATAAARTEPSQLEPPKIPPFLSGGVVARPRPEPIRKSAPEDQNSTNRIPALPRPVVSRMVAQAGWNQDSDPRPIPVPPRPERPRPNTPDPSQYGNFSTLPMNKQGALNYIPAIPVPPRPVRNFSDGGLRSHSVSPPLMNNGQDVKRNVGRPSCGSQQEVQELDTPLIQLSPPGFSQDFDVKELDPLCPKNSSRASTPVVPPRPVLSSNESASKLVVAPRPSAASNAFFSRGTSSPLIGSSINPAYGIPWLPPASGTGQYGNFTADSAYAVAALPVFQTPRNSEVTMTNDDLMDFTEQKDDPIYLSLQDFDPLFSIDERQSGHREYLDSLGICPSMGSTRSGASSAWPRPLAAANRTYEPSVLRQRPSETGNNQESQNKDWWPQQSAANPATSDFEELRDPFSFTDLTQSLERKRQKHTVEQERRMTLRRVSEERSKEPEKEVATEQQIPTKSNKAKGSSYEMLEEFHETADGEIEAFLHLVARIKLENSLDDPLSNAGYVISPMTKHIFYYDLTIKVTVSGTFFVEPVIFTCDVNTMVEHIITHVLVMLNDNLGGASADDFLLKVHSLSEFLINNSILADYEYVQQCLKLDKDIRFVLCDANSVSRPFKRHPEDDKHPVFVPKMRPLDNPLTRVTRDKLNILMETFYKEVEKLRDTTIQGSEKAHCKGVIQAVKAICTILHEIETVEVMKAIKRLKSVVLDQVSSDMYSSVFSASPNSRESCLSEDSSGYTRLHNLSDSYKRKSEVITMLDDLHVALDEVTRAVKSMIEMYCRTFHTEFCFESSTAPREVRDASGLQENLIIHLASAHRIPQQWRQSNMEYRIKCSLYYGGQRLADEILSQPKSTGVDSFPGMVIFDEWIQFEKVICGLPRETKIVFELIGVRLVPSNNSDGHLKVNAPLGWVAMQLYNHQFELVQGNQLLGIWPHGNANPCGTNFSNTDNPNSVLIQVNMPNFDFTYVFPAITESLPSLKQDFESLDAVDQKRLRAIIERDVLTAITAEECSFLWEKRYFVQNLPRALPRLIQSVPSWSASSLARIYAMVDEWAAPMSPLEGLQLLLPGCADTFIRSRAINHLRELSADELHDLLPQLVQALKFELYHTSALAILLLERAESSVRIAHQLYWLLKEAADNVQYRKRYQLMFGALLSVVGEGMREEFQKQEDLVKMLAAIADKVKSAKEKEAVLQHELHNMWEFLHHRTVRLPINPAFEVVGVDAKSCSYFTSFTCPLKLALKNIETQSGSIYSMFKAGDDLRQDMLTLQMIRIMDQLWMQEGLDLKMMIFRCQPTGLKRGLVELLMESETLRKIQMKHGHGLAGSFKDRTIAEWLQVHNPTELDYQKAVENFTDSCAGYCVATYILGICDRHNDNIMIKHSGHIFHIDFAKYLGDAQKFGNFKRDRAPFVLTSDMAFVINGGDKTSQKFQHFVDLCCRAFNIIRKHSNLFLTLFSLMTSSGIPGITQDAPRYIQKVLLTERSDAEAVADFTKMINTSLESIFTQLNFFLHNLAQMRFFGHEEGALLSFIPKTYSMETDGKIRNLEMHGIQKRYSPEKYYIYIVKVERENQRVPSFVMRRYSEFQELHRKLEMTFPLVQLPNLSGKRVIGRAHIRPVAENRKSELEAFMKELLRLAPEVVQHDLVYTFFHPMLRDEQDISKFNMLKLKEPPVNHDQIAARRIEGSIKLNLFYKQDTLTIMVMHVKDLGVTVAGEAPNPYVKLYLVPDLLKETKRKTRVAKHTFHPTYNEMLCYRMSLEQLKERTLQVTVWSCEALKENEFLGAAHVKLSELDLTRECPAWHKLQTLHVISST